MKKIAIFSRKIKENQINLVADIINKLDKQSCTLTLYKTLYEDIKDKLSLLSYPKIFNTHTEIESCSFLISIGGDGTLLDTISFIRDSGIPVLGLNIGKLGFLANTTLDNFEYSIKQIINNDYDIDKRTLIKIKTQNNIFGEINYALNEIAVIKSDISSMIKIDVYINELFLNTYWADGLLIATPTGSTAYSLSCGGPIVVPNSENFILTPIASHNLTVRPIVLSDLSQIKLLVNTNNTPFIICLDSRKYKTSKIKELLITKENFTFNLIKLKEENFFATIRNKLMWGVDKRN